MSQVATRILTAVIGTLFLVGCAAPAPPAEPVSHDLTQADLEAARMVYDAIIEAESRADWDAIADLTLDGFTNLDPRTGLLQGKATWRQWVDSMDFGNTEGVDYQVVEVGGSGDLAYVIWTFSGSWTEGGTPVTAQGKGMTLMARTPDGSWKGLSNAWNTTPGMEAGG